MPRKRIPADAPRPCRCGRGTLQPNGEPFYDADGLAQVPLACDAASCSIESVHS